MNSPGGIGEIVGFSERKVVAWVFLGLDSIIIASFLSGLDFGEFFFREFDGWDWLNLTLSFVAGGDNAVKLSFGSGFGGDNDVLDTMAFSKFNDVVSGTLYFYAVDELAFLGFSIINNADNLAAIFGVMIVNLVDNHTGGFIGADDDGVFVFRADIDTFNHEADEADHEAHDDDLNSKEPLWIVDLE